MILNKQTLKQISIRLRNIQIFIQHLLTFTIWKDVMSSKKEKTCNGFVAKNVNCWSGQEKNYNTISFTLDNVFIFPFDTYPCFKICFKMQLILSRNPS